MVERAVRLRSCPNSVKEPPLPPARLVARGAALSPCSSPTRRGCPGAVGDRAALRIERSSRSRLEVPLELGPLRKSGRSRPSRNRPPTSTRSGLCRHRVAHRAFRSPSAAPNSGWQWKSVRCATRSVFFLPARRRTRERRGRRTPAARASLREILATPRVYNRIVKDPRRSRPTSDHEPAWVTTVLTREVGGARGGARRHPTRCSARNGRWSATAGASAP